MFVGCGLKKATATAQHVGGTAADAPLLRPPRQALTQLPCRFFKGQGTVSKTQRCLWLRRRGLYSVVYAAITQLTICTALKRPSAREMRARQNKRLPSVIAELTAIVSGVDGGAIGSPSMLSAQRKGPPK